MFGKAIFCLSRNADTGLEVVPGIMSSSETPTSITSGPKVSSIARRSGISATHGAHQVAQTLITRSFAVFENTAAIFAGSLSGRRSAPNAGSASSALRDKAANRADSRIGFVHLHFDRSVSGVVLGALGSVRQQILRAKIGFELLVGLAQLVHVADDVRHAPRLRGQRLHPARSAQVSEAEADADE